MVGQFKMYSNNRETVLEKVTNVLPINVLWADCGSKACYDVFLVVCKKKNYCGSIKQNFYVYNLHNKMSIRTFKTYEK